MLALNRTAGKTTCGHLLPVPPPHSHHPFSSIPLYFRNPPRALPLLSLTRTRAASSSPPPLFGTSKPNQPSPFFDFARNPSLLSPIKTGFVTAITAAVIFISGFCFTVKPVLAWAVSPPATVGKVETEAGSSDVEVLQVDFSAKNGEIEVARLVFYLQLDIDLFRVTTAVHADSEELKKTSKEVEKALKQLSKMNKSDCRDLKLMSAVIKFLQRNYDQAMKIYDELEKEYPIDCSLYFFRGMTYIALEKKEEAEESFEMYRKFVAKKHPFAKFYYSTMLATKIVAPKAWDERAARKG